MTTGYKSATVGPGIGSDSSAVISTGGDDPGLVAAALTSFDSAFKSGTNTLVTLLGANAAYSTTTHQFSGTMSGNATITPTQGTALMGLVNTALTALLAAKPLAAPSKGVLLAYDTALSKNQLKAALRSIIDGLGV